MSYVAFIDSGKGSGVAPVYRGRGPTGGSSPFFSDYTVSWPTVGLDGLEPEQDDFALLMIYSPGNTTTATPSGWTVVTGSPVLDVASSAGCSLNVFYQRLTSVPPATCTVTKVGNCSGGAILLFSGVVDSGDPWDVMTTDSTSSDSTTITWPSVSPEVTNPLMVYLAARPNDTAAAQYSGYTSTSGAVTSLTERFDAGVTSGGGQGGVVVTGAFGSGSTGTVTATKATSTTDAMMVLALYG